MQVSGSEQLFICCVAGLATGGCISAFKWNSGADEYKAKPWDESLPTDSAVRSRF